MASPYLYSVRPLVAADLDACLRILADAAHGPFPISAPLRRDLATRFLTNHVEAGAAVAAIDSQGELVGYAAFDSFDFHGENAAFCPLSGHGASPSRAPDVYEALYIEMSHRWVAAGIHKHLVSIPASDRAVERRFFDIGFGRYVVDAYMPIDEHTDCSAASPSARPGETLPRRAERVSIRRANRIDARGLAALIDESVGWYASSPIFLRTDPTPAAEVDELLSSDDAAVFLADRDGAPIGFMGVQLVDRPNPIALTGPGTATLDGIGGYLQPDARRLGIGEALLARCWRWAAGRGANSVHVDYESANPAARSFWPRYFVPGSYSLMRHTHADMQEPQSLQ